MELHGNKSSIPICPGAGRAGITIATANYRKGSGISKEEAIANAHLFAASKRLYEVLEKFEATKELWLPTITDDEHANETVALHALRQEMLEVLAAARGEKEVEDE